MSIFSTKDQQEIKSFFYDLNREYSKYIKKAYEYCKSENNDGIITDFQLETILFFKNIEVIKVIFY